VLHNGVWGTACIRYDYQAAETTARVVCRILGFGYVGRPIRDNYGLSPGQIWLNAVRCNRAETNIDECTYNGWGVSGCSSYREYQAVSCLTEGAVALFGGRSPREGRLEVYHNGRWGTVCDDGFTDAAVKVVCYSLGFGYIGREVNIDAYGMGEGTIWLDDIECSGTEEHISNCSHRGWGSHNCGHHEDVAISCVGES